MSIAGSLPKQKSFIVDSIFDSEIADFDRNVAFVNLNDLENLFDLETSKAIYNRKTGELSLDGNVKLKGPKVSSDSSSLFLDLKKNTMDYR